MFSVIMAGGGGTRLWPKSREHNPKQMHPLTGAKPLVQDMVELQQYIVGEENVYIITNSHHAVKMKEAMPFIKDKILIDPFRRDTAACIGLAAVYLSKIDPNAVMGVFAADHYIGLHDKFKEVALTAEKLASEGNVVTIGLKPTGPETGYGYIEMGEPFAEVNGRRTYKVRRFVEKPNHEKAVEYVEAGNYLWNSGMFVWSLPTLFELYEKNLPDTFAKLMKIRDAIGTPNEENVLLHEYDRMQCISVDYGIMEKIDQTVVIPGDFDWNDVGSWATVWDIAKKDAESNAVTASHIGLDTKNCLIMGNDGRVIATVGVEDLVIVDTEDAILICPRDRAQDVKKIVENLKDLKLEKYL